MFLVIFAAIIKVGYDYMKDFDFSISTLDIQLSLIILFSILIAYFIFKKIRSIIKEKIREFEHFKYLLDKDLKALTTEEIQDFIKELRFDEHNKIYGLKIKRKVLEARLLMKKKSLEEQIKDYERRKDLLFYSIEELEKKHYLEKLRLENKNYYTFLRLKGKEKLFFEFDELSNEEVEALKEHDFEKTAQYDPLTKKNKTFMVKEIMNHSLEHTFLVGRIKQILEEYIDERKIYLHETKDADITFKFKNKMCAVEIETGTLLSKKDQARKKVKLLNKKYGNRWFFVVTHRKLITKYKKYGLVTHRSGVSKFLKKLLKK